MGSRQETSVANTSFPSKIRTPRLRLPLLSTGSWHLLATMSSSLHVPDNLEEQDIALYYHSRRSSLSISDTDVSSLAHMSRPTSQPELDTMGQAFARHLAHDSLKSPSLSQVTDDRRLTAPQTVLRSKTLPDLPSTASTQDDSPSFAFSVEKVQKMQEWVLAFVVGKLLKRRFTTEDVNFIFIQFSSTSISDRSCEQYTLRCTSPLRREKTCSSFINVFSVYLTYILKRVLLVPRLTAV